MVTTGILLGHEIGEWAGFKSGKLIVKMKDGNRKELRFSQRSSGGIPKIGSIVEIEHTVDIFPEILTIECIDDDKSRLYKEGAQAYASTLFLGRSHGVNLLVFTLIFAGIATILLGLLSGATEAAAPLIFGLCGVPYIILGYLIWIYAGE
ncbi:MAG: hypothetical protein ACFFEV_10120 [Candidatus Thorarchaeota archaeon]